MAGSPDGDMPLKRSNKRTKRKVAPELRNTGCRLPLLPVEVLRIIFEFTTFTSRKQLPGLCLVCKRSNSWISPILYRTVVLKTMSACCQFRRTADIYSKGDAHTSYLCGHTKTLFIPFLDIPSEILDAILVACSNLTVLSCNTSRLNPGTFRTRLLPSLSQLYMTNPFDHDQILPAHLTHLASWAASRGGPADTAKWRGLFAQCPLLTHFAFNSSHLRLEHTFLNLSAILPAQIQRVIVIVEPSVLGWRSLQLSVLKAYRKLPRNQTRIVAIAIDRYGGLCDPTYIDHQHNLVRKKMVQGITGMDYLGDNREDIWTLGERVASELDEYGDILGYKFA